MPPQITDVKNCNKLSDIEVMTNMHYYSCNLHILFEKYLCEIRTHSHVDFSKGTATNATYHTEPLCDQSSNQIRIYHLSNNKLTTPLSILFPSKLNVGKGRR